MSLQNALIYLKIDGLPGNSGHTGHTDEFLLGGTNALFAPLEMGSYRKASGRVRAQPVRVLLANSSEADIEISNAAQGVIQTAASRNTTFTKATITAFSRANTNQEVYRCELDNVMIAYVDQHTFDLDYRKFKHKETSFNPDGTANPGPEVWFDITTNTTNYDR